MRIISLISSATEIISSLECSELLVGISHECDYPEEIINLPICSEPKLNVNADSLEIDFQVKSLLQEALSIYRIKEKVISRLNPDLIITQSQCDVCAVSLDDVRNFLKSNLGINPMVLSLEPRTINDVIKDIWLIGKKLNKEQAAFDITNSFNEQINHIKDRNLGKNRITVACIEWIDPLMYAGNWVPEIVEIAGGLNIYGERGKHSTWSKHSTLFQKDPNKIIFMPCGYNIEKTKGEIGKLFKKKDWSRLKAVKSGNVFVVDGSQYFNRPGPRLLDSIKIMDDIISDKNEYEFQNIGWERVLI